MDLVRTVIPLDEIAPKASAAAPDHSESITVTTNELRATTRRSNSAERSARRADACSTASDETEKDDTLPPIDLINGFTPNPTYETIRPARRLVNPNDEVARTRASRRLRVLLPLRPTSVLPEFRRK
ncbi:hypothetical protein [Frondihabitans sp. PAMC 28766]|uniref:hypothetical protein n=1 Tax=Frondihabitans sp. PAMC 28766 TaxID=1795630 RepID=UPI0012FF6530|nr:hypothetical protein [Frondihabitans sp. PAMC 28766]